MVYEDAHDIEEPIDVRCDGTSSKEQLAIMDAKLKSLQESPEPFFFLTKIGLAHHYG